MCVCVHVCVCFCGLINTHLVCILCTYKLIGGWMCVCACGCVCVSVDSVWLVYCAVQYTVCIGT